MPLKIIREYLPVSANRKNALQVTALGSIYRCFIFTALFLCNFLSIQNNKNTIPSVQTPETNQFSLHNITKSVGLI